MQVDLQCNDQISWIKMGESGSQDHEKEMKGHILEIVYMCVYIYICMYICLYMCVCVCVCIHTRIFSYNSRT